MLGVCLSVLFTVGLRCCDWLVRSIVCLWCARLEADIIESAVRLSACLLALLASVSLCREGDGVVVSVTPGGRGGRKLRGT